MFLELIVPLALAAALLTGVWVHEAMARQESRRAADLARARAEITPPLKRR